MRIRNSTAPHSGCPVLYLALLETASRTPTERMTDVTACSVLGCSRHAASGGMLVSKDAPHLRAATQCVSAYRPRLDQPDRPSARPVRSHRGARCERGGSAAARCVVVSSIPQSSADLSDSTGVCIAPARPSEKREGQNSLRISQETQCGSRLSVRNLLHSPVFRFSIASRAPSLFLRSCMPSSLPSGRPKRDG